MSATTATKPATTADDTLQAKRRDGSVLSGGHLVAKALKAEGVDTIFTLCGGHIIDIYDGCIDEGIRIVDVRHEQTAAHAADGYSRQTGKLGCVVTPAGPGCTNAVTGIATAFRSESPVLHIGGQSALGQWRMGGLQDLPHVDMMKPITKFASTVMSTERVADMVSMAARECFAGAYGPSYLEIPRDILDREIDATRAVLPKRGHYAKYGEERGSVGNLLGDIPFGEFAEMLGGSGEEVRDASQIADALRRGREAVRRDRKSAVINIWVDPREYAPGTKAQTMYK